MKKKETKRSKEKYPALKPKVNSRVRQEYNDYDYIDQLSDEEKQWLNDFTEEYSNAAVGKQSEADKNRFHNTPELVKDCTDRNNSRNRCFYGIQRNRVGATKMLNYEDASALIEQEANKDVDYESVEDAFIDYLDEKLIDTVDSSGDETD